MAVPIDAHLVSNINSYMYIHSKTPMSLIYQFFTEFSIIFGLIKRANQI